MRRTAGISILRQSVDFCTCRGGLLTFDYGEGDGPMGPQSAFVPRVYTDNVVDLIGRQVERLPVENAASIAATCVHGQQRGVRPAGDGFRAIDGGNAWASSGKRFELASSSARNTPIRSLHDRVHEASVLIDSGGSARRGTSPNRQAACDATLRQKIGRSRSSRSSTSLTVAYRSSLHRTNASRSPS